MNMICIEDDERILLFKWSKILQHELLMGAEERDSAR